MNLSVVSCFDENIAPEKILRYLETPANRKIIPGKTLLLFDGIQSVPLYAAFCV